MKNLEAASDKLPRLRGGLPTVSRTPLYLGPRARLHHDSYMAIR
jgi:hypothetical protein